MAGDAWYYVNGEARIGPVEKAEILRLVDAGQIGGSTLVWREGLDGWEEASAHFPVAASASPPPMPNRSAQPSVQFRPEHDTMYGAAPPREFFEAVQVCFNKFAVFSGRASRSEFWYFQLAAFLAGLATGILDTALFGSASGFSPINTILSLAILLPSLSVSVRRLHDTGRSGWWIGGFYILIGGLAAVIGIIGAGGDNGFNNMGALLGLLGIAVLVLSIVMIVFLAQKGEPRPNRFG